jgi:hypothetical protein
MSFRIIINEDFVVEQVKLTEKVYKFLESKGIEQKLNQNFEQFHRKVVENNNKSEFVNCEAFISLLDIRFGEIEDGESSSRVK